MIRVTIALLATAFAANAVASDGEDLYQRCAACHLADGAGIPGIFPPLRDRINIISTGAEGRTYIVMVIVAGLIGPVNVDGTLYNGVMPGQPMSNADIASILNYLGTTFDADPPNDWHDFSAEEVAEIRQGHASPTGQASLRLRKKVAALKK